MMVEPIQRCWSGCTERKAAPLGATSHLCALPV
jgi:hypothetical protein